MKKILFILFSFLLMVACDSSEQNVTSTPKQQVKSDNVAEVVTEYKILPAGAGGRCWVDKWVIDDHEYLIFGSGLANPPTVIHNEACPCMETK